MFFSEAIPVRTAHRLLHISQRFGIGTSWDRTTGRAFRELGFLSSAFMAITRQWWLTLQCAGPPRKAAQAGDFERYVA
jgi:hypothetical protein